MDFSISPKHLAIIMDGNGRWAKNKGLSRIEGHFKGAQVAKEIVRSCAKQSIEVLSLFAFSHENWGRPTEEVTAIFDLFLEALTNELPMLHENQVHVRFIGDNERLPETLQNKIKEAQSLTKKNTGLKLVIAFAYSGRWEITNAVKKLASDVQAGKLSIASIDESKVAKALCLPDLPEPDLLIRTSGEQRISNFMLWQLAYTELFFTDIMWPDFTIDVLAEALDFFASRRRRFGLIEPAED